jgi:uncharacterized membrane protein
MKARLAVAWDAVRSSYWFVPLLLVLASIAVALVALEIDPGRPESHDLIDPTPFGSANSARQFLSGVASSSITIAGLAFSIAIVAMSLAASQYGPRLLRNFVQDLGNQLTLGAFVALFAFCLIVLGGVRGDGDAAIVPILAVRLAFALSIVDIFVLIFFIHHAATEIQIANIIAAAGSDLDATVSRRYPSEIGIEPAPDPNPAGGVPPGAPDGGQPVLTPRTGYVQAVDGVGLVADAVSANLVVRLVVRPGSFVGPGMLVAVAWPAERATPLVIRSIERRLLLGRQRTELQDIEFAIQQIVQIAVRALSPAINDPFTAYACVDRLGLALAELASQAPPSSHRLDAAGSLRIVADVPTFDALLSQAVSEVRRSGRGSLTVTVRLLEMLAMVAARASRPTDLEAIRRQGERVEIGSRDDLSQAWERQVIDDRLAHVVAAMPAKGASKAN